MKKKKSKRKKTGSRLLLAVVLVGSLCLAAAPAGGKPKKSKGSEVWAVIGGTVFRDPGFALPGAKITLELDGDTSKEVKVKRQEYVSNLRGEFSFRVPPVPLRYTVSVRAAGFQAEKKQVEIHGEQRVDVYFQLKPEAPKP